MTTSISISTLNIIYNIALYCFYNYSFSWYHMKLLKKKDLCTLRYSITVIFQQTRYFKKSAWNNRIVSCMSICYRTVLKFILICTIVQGSYYIYFLSDCPSLSFFHVLFILFWIMSYLQKNLIFVQKSHAKTLPFLCF